MQEADLFMQTRGDVMAYYVDSRGVVHKTLSELVRAERGYE